MPQNKGAVITGSRDLLKLVAVRPIPYPTLNDDSVIVRAVAYAVNPTDWKHIIPEEFVAHRASEIFRVAGLGIKPLQLAFGCVGHAVGNFLGKGGTLYMKGNVSGTDVSGVIEEVGKNVKNFKKGDIVTGTLHGGISKNSAFSDYVRIHSNTLIKYSNDQIQKLPLSVGDHPSGKITSFEGAATLGVATVTTGWSLHINLQIPPNKEQNKDDYLLVWGGSTATAMVLIQYAKLIYGIKVITTASKKNHELLKSLGADIVIDYNDKDVIEQLKQAGQGKIKYAVDCVSSTSTWQSVYDALEGSENATMDNLLFLTSSSLKLNPKRKVRFTMTNGYLSDGTGYITPAASPEVMKKFKEYMLNLVPAVIDQIRTAPLKVLPSGFESANEGMNLLIKNKVSAQKVVFRNDDPSILDL